jgi:hypothetical protein
MSWKINFMKTLILSSILLLTGCANTCTHACLFGVIGPGNTVFDAYAKHADTMDPCQYVGKPEGYKLASFCFANAGKKVYHVRDTNNRIIYKIQ